MERVEGLGRDPRWPKNVIIFLVVTGLTQPMDPDKKSLNFIFPTKYVIPKSLKFSHWPSKLVLQGRGKSTPKE